MNETPVDAPPRTGSDAALGGYLGWSCDPAVAVLGVVPLWLLYEALRWSLAPAERNGAEALVTDSLRLIGSGAQEVLEVVLACVVVAAAVSVLRRQVPWARVALVAALEGSVYGLVLGPVTQVLTLFLLDRGVLAAGALAADLVGSLGAGIFEEAVFRLGMLSVLALAFTRLCRLLGVGSWLGILCAVGLTAVAFSAFHHIGPGGEAYRPEIFAFRAVAGVVLGLLFVLRGFCVVVYAHAVYDVHYYLVHG